MAIVNDYIMPCTPSNIMYPFLLTCDAHSDMPFEKEGPEEPGDFRLSSNWLTSGTNSFCNNDGGQPLVRGIMRELMWWFTLLPRLSPDQDRRCEQRAYSVGPACLG